MTTEAIIAHTHLLQSKQAGWVLGRQIKEMLLAPPDVIILFAAPCYNHQELLFALKESTGTELIVGCSSSGEFTSIVQGTGLCCAVAIRSEDMYFSAALGHHLRSNVCQATRSIADSFQSNSTPAEYKYYAALILYDALSGHTDDFIRHFALLTEGKYELFGGGAGDNAEFRNTPVFYNTDAVNDAVVALEIRSKKPIGIGAYHGWRPITADMYVTAAEGKRIISVEGRPALEVFTHLAWTTEQCFDPKNPMPFFLHNIFGISGANYQLRVPLQVHSDGSITCAAEIPPHSCVAIMNATSASPIEAAKVAAREAADKLYGGKATVALFFDCVASRLRMGSDFGFELQAVQETIGEVNYAGCNSHGQIARLHGQFSSFHNCTAVIALLPS